MPTSDAPLQPLDTVSFALERGKLAELARALGDPDPVWHDPAAARAAGFDDLPVLPTATVLTDHWRGDGALTHALRLGLSVETLLHGERSWEYVRPLRAGEELTATTAVIDRRTREGRRGGAMTLITLETRFEDADGRLVVRQQDTLIDRGAAA